jgi:hypothetical protein
MPSRSCFFRLVEYPSAGQSPNGRSWSLTASGFASMRYRKAQHRWHTVMVYGASSALFFPKFSGKTF